MSKKKTIHDLRCALAFRRQPEHKSDLEKLLKAVPPSDHPYRDDKNPDCYPRLLDLPEFRWPSKGRPADLADGAYLFHLRPLGGFVSRIKVRFPAQSPAPPGSDPTINLDKVRKVLDEATLNQAWVSLALIAEGVYEAESPGTKPRFITWWTDLAIKQDDILRQAHQIGVPRDWLYSDCVLLRCRIDNVIRGQARIPSSLDGFASEIFLPCDYAESPSSGRAIDIGTEPFENGNAEFVLGPIEVGRISIRLIRIPRAATPSFVDSGNPMFLDKLEDYYRSKLI
jgi:hypothetical protein